MMSRGSLIAGVGIGAGITYFLDPDRGGSRRARVRDAVTHTEALARRTIGATRRDARHRALGVVASLRAAMSHEEVDDQVLTDRVRTKLGRLVSHPHAITVIASDAVVWVRGPILEREAEPLLRAIRRVRGVKAVIDHLERYAQTAYVPALQGGREPAGDRIDIWQARWAPATRAIAGGVGATFITGGALRRDARGAAALLIGSALLARAATNLPLSRLTKIATRRHAVEVQKTITINASVGEVYAFWSLYENFPRYMSRVLEVMSDPDLPYRSHWKVAGPAGATVEFDAEVTSALPNQMIAWRTLPGSPVAHAGMVSFDPVAGGGTRLHVRLSYTPPAGWLGHEIATVFGVDPKSSLDADMVRMKTLIETGRVPHDAAQSSR